MDIIEEISKIKNKLNKKKKKKFTYKISKLFSRYKYEYSRNSKEYININDTLINIVFNKISNEINNEIIKNL